jgi:hypothetical protein
MAGDFEIEVSLKKSEVVRYNFFHIRWIIAADIIGMGIFLYLVYGSFYHPESGARELLGTLSVWAAVVLAFGLSQPLIIILQIYIFKSRAFADFMARRIYDFSDSGIRVNSRGKNAEKKWVAIKGIKNTDGLLLIYTAPRLAYVIPRRCFESRKRWFEFIRFLRSRFKRQK